MKDWDSLWINAHLATMAEDRDGYGSIRDGAIAAKDGHIAWLGSVAELPKSPDQLADRVEDCAGRWLLPGLIDCHTHMVYGGNRAGEFEQRLEGASYEDIAKAGGGILSTVTATRQADDATLLDGAAKRLAPLIAEGVTTVEIKSGYGLNAADEAKQLRVARQLGATADVRVKTTFLGAHALPPEFSGRADAYVDLVIEEALPHAAGAGLADAVDVFCETIAFSPAQCERVFAAAKAHGLPIKAHVEQLSDLGGAQLAARHGALSCDHLEFVTEPGVAAMAAASTVAVLLPGAFYFLRETKVPPIDLFRAHGVPMALATDCNPGSAPVTSLLLMLNMACTLFRMTPAEALAGVTRSAAQALGLGASHGTLEVGKAADFALFDIGNPAELSYRIGYNPCVGRVVAGQ